MEHIREYLLSVTAAALVCGMIRSLAGEKGSIGGLVRLLCGIFLSLTVIRPLADIRLQEFSFFADEILDDARSAAEEGTDYAYSAMARHIKESCEAYILDKALLYDAHITAEVEIGGETPVPVGCTIRGELSPYARQQLSRMLEDEIGIGEEDQHWISESS